jgi:hypothetical protein
MGNSADPPGRAQQLARVLGRGEDWALRRLGQEDARALDVGLENGISANGEEVERALPSVLRRSFSILGMILSSSSKLIRM